MLMPLLGIARRGEHFLQQLSDLKYRNVAKSNQHLSIASKFLLYANNILSLRVQIQSALYFSTCMITSCISCKTSSAKIRTGILLYSIPLCARLHTSAFDALTADTIDISTQAYTISWSDSFCLEGFQHPFPIVSALPLLVPPRSTFPCIAVTRIAAPGVALFLLGPDCGYSITTMGE